VSRIARQFDIRLEERVNERTRIARDLHDTLLQSFQGVLLRFQTVSNLLAEGPSKQKLDSVIEQAAGAITEGRDAVQQLRSSQVDAGELPLAVRTLGEELAADAANRGSAVFQVEVEGEPRSLHPILRDEIYRVAGEALRNAFRHAQAHRIEVEIRYDDRQLRLRVRDDGKGVDPKALDVRQRSGHWGLHGMHERARLVGGILNVWSEVKSGTEVELIVPAAKAYATFPSRRHSWWSEKLSWKGMVSKA
jgi:signal transduction histidine kinase